MDVGVGGGVIGWVGTRWIQYKMASERGYLLPAHAQTQITGIKPDAGWRDLVSGEIKGGEKEEFRELLRAGCRCQRDN